MDSFKLLALSLVLFLGGCSTDPSNNNGNSGEGSTGEGSNLSETDLAFLTKVKGKTVYSDVDQYGQHGTFSSDGTVWTQDSTSMALEFIEATDENTGSYRFSMNEQSLTAIFTLTSTQWTMKMNSTQGNLPSQDVFVE